MIYNTLWNILLGIIGGIISSLIVSKVFLIQGDFQDHCKAAEHLLHRLYYIRGFYRTAKVVFEVSYDGEIEMQHEMETKGYKTEEEYYVANKDKDWISKSALLKKFIEEVHKAAGDGLNEIMTSTLSINPFPSLVNKIHNLLSKASDLKEFSFSEVNEFEQRINEVAEDYDKIRKASGKQIVSLVFRNKMMIVLLILLMLIVVFTIIAALLGI